MAGFSPTALVYKFQMDTDNTNGKNMGLEVRHYWSTHPDPTLNVISSELEMMSALKWSLYIINRF